MRISLYWTSGVGHVLAKFLGFNTRPAISSDANFIMILLLPSSAE